MGMVLEWISVNIWLGGTYEGSGVMRMFTVY